MRMAAAFLILLMAGSAALAGDGPVTMWFEKGPSEVSDALANLCADRQSVVVEQDDRHVLCVREVKGMKGVLAQALIGNAYSTTPELHIRFSILRDRTSTRVQVSQWVETQMALGQVRRQQLDSRKQSNSLEELLATIGGHNVQPQVSSEQPGSNDMGSTHPMATTGN